EASMGVGIDDLDADGDLDILLTHLVVETHTLYRQRGPLLFDDVTDAAGLGGASRAHTGFGTVFVDLDGDGWRDLFVANGAVQSIASLATAGDPWPYHETNQVFRHPGAGFDGVPRFTEVGQQAGPVLDRSEISRGVAIGDLDQDGDRDLIVTQNGGPARILASSAADDRAWIGLRVVDGQRDALGAIVTLTTEGGVAGPRTRSARIATDGSYVSASDPRAAFVLGPGERPTGLRVRWPGSASVEQFPPPPASAYADIRRGDGTPLTDAPP
ncbi:MAG: CRTAC1 family protein, partial [Acidobacteriota bacterium]